MTNFFRLFRGTDWVLLFCIIAISILGIITIKPFGSLENGYFFSRQIIWIASGVFVFFLALLVDWNFLKTNGIFLFFLYLFLLAILFLLIFTANSIKGATSWYRVYSLGIEPVELMKVVLVLLFAKYFSKRHVEIARFFHIIVSGMYALLPIGLVLLQPDFGSAMVLAALWLGMAIVGGIKIKHLLLLFVVGILAFGILWNFVLAPYQKARIISFLNPKNDIRGTGYHAVQSMIAVGSGGIFGKGIGYGTQSRLEFLPENETDFIFASFAEEWGFFGVIILFFFFSIILWRILRAGIYAENNFEKLYAAGLSILLFFQSLIHIGMNVGMLPITGLGFPFLSYGGSSMLSLFLAVGILQSFQIRQKGIFIGSEEKYKEGVLGV